MSYRVEQRHRGYRGFGQRQNDFQENPQIRAAVHPGRLFQFFGNALEIIFYDYHIKGAYRTGQPQGPVGIGQLQAAYHQIAGNHTPGKKHGNDNHIDEKVTPPQIRPGKGIGQGCGKQHINRRTDHRNNN